MDDKNSLHVAEGDGGRVLLHCHAGCAVQEIVHRAGRAMSDLFSADALAASRAERKPSRAFGEPTATYDYTDEDGGLLFQVQRDAEKNFRQRRPSNLEPPADAWIYDVREMRRVLYRLPDLLAAIDLQRRGKFPQPIFVVEGEKDANGLAALGLIATTNSGGAGKWTDDHTKQIAGATEVVILTDNDEPGRRHADAIAATLGEGVKRVRILKLPALPEKGDVSDWIAAGGTREQLISLAEETPLNIPPSARFTSIALGAADFVKRNYEKPRSLLGDGLLSAGDLAFFYGQPGLGKTWAVLMLAHALVRGEPWFGIETAGKGLRVGILELELHAFRLQERLKVVAGKDLDNALEIVSRPDLKGAVDVLDDTQWSAWTTWCRDHKLDILIVDALSRAHHVDESHAADFAPVLARFDELRHETGTAIVPIHHEPKAKSMGKAHDDMDALRGTSRMASDANLLMRLVKVGRGDDLCVLRFPKVNNAATPAPIHLLRQPSGLFIVTEAPEKKSDRSECRILKALHDGLPQGLTNEEIQERVGLKRAAVSKHLSALDAVEVGQKPPRYLPPSTASTGSGVELVNPRDAKTLVANPGELLFPPPEHLPSSTPSTLKGGKARGSCDGLVPRDGTEATP